MIQVKEFTGNREQSSAAQLNSFLKKHKEDINIEEIKYKPVVIDKTVVTRYCLIYDDEPFDSPIMGIYYDENEEDIKDELKKMEQEEKLKKHEMMNE
ncbi:MAG: hypothetical protein ACOCT9_00260 [archaeon]